MLALIDLIRSLIGGVWKTRRLQILTPGDWGLGCVLWFFL
jgi:hypothetical protein